MSKKKWQIDPLVEYCSIFDSVSSPRVYKSIFKREVGYRDPLIHVHVACSASDVLSNLRAMRNRRGGTQKRSCGEKYVSLWKEKKKKEANERD